jgi:hypothetical protein
MTFDQITESMTPLGFGAAVIGLILCVAVLAIRFRAQNIAQGAISTAQTKPEVSPETEQPPKPKSAFKPYVPDGGDEPSDS